MFKKFYRNSPTSRFIASDDLIGNFLVNPAGEQLGDIDDFILDMDTGQIAYVAFFFLGLIGMGEKLFAVPWQALIFDGKQKNLVINIAKERLKLAPSFDKSYWPVINDQAWREQTELFFLHGVTEEYGLANLRQTSK